MVTEYREYDKILYDMGNFLSKQDSEISSMKFKVESGLFKALGDGE